MQNRESKVIALRSRAVAPARSTTSAQSAEAPLRVLIIDDTPEDRMVVRLALESQGYLLNEATTGARGLAAAAALRPDCILLDYHLPDFDGLEVLDALRRPDGAMPCAIVMLTGSSNGAMAAMLLKTGALDYLAKEHMGEDSLRRAVHGSVERYRLMEARRRDEARNAHLAALVESSTDAIVSADPDDRVISWNPGAAAMFGYTEDEAIGRTIEALIVPPNLIEQRRKLYADVKAGRVALALESERRRKDGSVVPVEINASPVFAADGAVSGVSVIFRDITDRRRASANLAFLAELGVALAPQKSSADVARIATRRIADFFEASRCMLVDIDPAQDRADVACESSADGAPSIVGAYKISDFHTKKEMAQLFEGRPLVIRNTRPHRSAAAAAHFAALGVGALVNIPHMHQGRCRFLLSIARAAPTRWRDDEVELLREAAARVYIRLERARAEEALSDRSRQLDLLARTSQRLRLGREAERETLQSIFREIAAHLGVEIFYHYRPADDARLLRLDLFDGVSDDEQRAFATMSFGELLCGRVAQSRESLIIEDLQHSAQPGSEALHAAGATSYAGFPLVSNGKLVGTIAFVSRKRVTFRDGEMQMVQTICDQIATSLERARLERQLARSEARLQQALEAASAGVWESTPATGEFWASERAMAIHGLPPDAAMTHERALAAVHPEDRPLVEAALRDTLDTGAPFRVEMRALSPDGSVRWLSSRAELKRGSSHPKLVGLLQDITERKQVEERLRAAHDTLLHLIERSPFGIYLIDADFRIVQVGQGAQKVFETVRPLIGRDLAEVLRLIWAEPFASDAIARFRHTLETGEPYVAESTERRADIDATEAYDWKIERITMPDGRFGVVCHFYDLSERKRHEEHVQLLMHEVNHRSKNMLAMVQAIARQTASTRPEDFIERFAHRIQAMAANQDLLVKSDWKAVQFSELVRAQLPHVDETRISIDGAAVEIGASAAQTLGMALHELATNAAKHGALSNQSGRVAIRWGVRADACGNLRFTMEWVESGGPRVEKPTRRGFGSTVIGRMIEAGLGCDSVIDFAPTGLAWRIDCPAENVLASAPSPPHSNRMASDAPTPSAGRRRVLVVEDEPLIALEIAATLSAAGLEVIGPAGAVAHARALIAQAGCDAAVLDTNLGAESAEPVALDLTARAIPFVVVSGYSRTQQPAAMQDAPLLGKPVMLERLVAEIGKLVETA